MAEGRVGEIADNGEAPQLTEARTADPPPTLGKPAALARRSPSGSALPAPGRRIGIAKLTDMRRIATMHAPVNGERNQTSIDRRVGGHNSMHCVLG